jgi:hypothetical protein
VTTTQKILKAMTENNSTHSTDAAAIVSMEIHTSMNGT